MKRTIEIRSAEGGEDSKLFVSDLTNAYQRLGTKKGWTTRLIDVRPGECSLLVEGLDLSGLDNEPGGHRIQRIPPTERKGRVHTSTVTVAVIDESAPLIKVLNADLKIEWYSGTGAGGQYRNKHQNSCRITHLPTGITAKAECRSRQNSLAEAVASIQNRVDAEVTRQYNNSIASDRKQQVGTGMRGDKIRTYRFQDDIVKDHLTGKTAKCSAVLKGNIDFLWS